MSDKRTFKETDIAFVTGAGSGIGRATCQLLAEQGATVVAAGLTKEKVDQTVSTLPGKNHTSIQLDVSKKTDVEATVAEIIAKYSWPPNIVVNSAGKALGEPIIDTTQESFNRMFGVAVEGTIWVTSAVCKELMAANKSGSIINVSGMSSQGMAYVAVHGAAKGAMESFTRSAAKEFGPCNIRVNAVCAGAIDTPMIAHYGEYISAYCNSNPMGRVGTPQEVAEVIAFLASDKSSYVNGTVMFVHGGHI